MLINPLVGFGYNKKSSFSNRLTFTELPTITESIVEQVLPSVKVTEYIPGLRPTKGLETPPAFHTKLVRKWSRNNSC